VTEIQQNRWDQLIRRAANVVGGASQVNDTLNELFPVIDVERVPGELLALSGMRLCWAGTQLVASPAEFNHHQIFNPVDSGALIVITQVDMFALTTTSFRFTNGIAVLATLAGNERRRDTRQGIDADVLGQNRTDQSAVSGGLDFRIRAVASGSVNVKDDNGIAILFPGTGLTITADTTNIISAVHFMWRERTFEPAEVNF